MSLASADADTSSSRQGDAVNPFYALLKTIGSLWLTVGLLFFLIGILLWGTVVEKYYGDTAAKFGIYGSWWFNTLGFAIGLNSAASLILRWPWKRQHIGFVLPHLGLIVLLVGCLISRKYGIEATLSVVEGQTSNRAYQGTSQHVELDGNQRFQMQVLSSDATAQHSEPIEAPFTSGPFNWQDYENGYLSFLPWSMAHRDQGEIYNHDGIRLEVLDYLSNSDVVYLPNLTVEAAPASSGGDAAAEGKAFTLNVKTDDGALGPRLYGKGSEAQSPGGKRVLFWMSGSEAETLAFTKSAPKGPLGKRGRVVLSAQGEVYDWPLDDWQIGSRRPLGKSGLEAELVGLVREQDEVLVRIDIHKDTSVQRLILSSEFPDRLNWQDYSDGVMGSYWLGRTDKPGEATAAKPQAADAASGMSAEQAAADAVKDLPPVPPRVDFFQGADHELYLRTWRDGQVKVVGRLRLGDGGGRITAFPRTPDALSLKFSDFQPADRPSTSAGPLAFDKNEESYRLRQAQVRLTVDGKSDEFWLPCSSYDPLESRAFILPKKLFHHTVAGNGRRVQLTLVPQSFELGFSVRLNHAWAKLDPGSRNKSFYASEIDLLPNMPEADLPAGTSAPREYDNLLVTLNAPLDFTDPRSGKSFRMFQATMNGPFKPQQLDIKMGDPVYVSGLSLNDDPGRGLTYLGCLMVVAGIFAAYFIRIVPKKAA